MPPVIEHPHERFERHGELADALPSIFLAFGFAYAFGMFLTGGLIFLISKYGGSSMTNAFYITLVTVEDIELGEYDEVASAFVKAFYNVTSEHLTLTEFTGSHTFQTHDARSSTQLKQLRFCRRMHRGRGRSKRIR